jgi:thymidylate synthase (FAD)
LLKHRISSLNAESARYKELKEDKFYIPEDWTEKHQNNLIAFTKMSNQWYHETLEELTPILGRKRAKESARYFKTYNSQIQSDVQFNMRSFANFLKLRNSEHAQKEIREIAAEMLELVKSIEGNPFKHTLQAMGY